MAYTALQIQGQSREHQTLCISVELFPVYTCFVFATSHLGKMSLLSILCETHLTELVAQLMQSSGAMSAKIVHKLVENFRVSVRVATAGGGTGYGAFGDALHAVSSHKRGSRGTLSSPFTPRCLCLMLSALANFTVLLLQPSLRVWTQWG